jgi:hypothetical protein
MFSADIPATAQAWLVVVSDMEEWGMLNELAHVIGANLSISHPSCLLARIMMVMCMVSLQTHLSEGVGGGLAGDY